MNAYRQNKTTYNLFQQDNPLAILIGANVVMFVLLYLIEIIYSILGSGVLIYKETFFNWLSLTSGLDKLITRPWTLLTHFFVEYSFVKLISNMLWLWFFGFIFQDLVGNRKLIPLYIYASFIGGLSFIILFNILPLTYSAGIIWGSGMGIVAIAIAATVIAPSYKILPMLNGGISLWIITGIYLLINVTYLVSSSLPFLLSYVAAGAVGYLFIQQLNKGKDWSKGMNNAWYWFINLFNPDKKTIKQSLQKEIFYNTNGRQPFYKTPLVTSQKIDAILDKISQQGYDALSQEEKDILNRAAEADNAN